MVIALVYGAPAANQNVLATITQSTQSTQTSQLTQPTQPVQSTNATVQSIQDPTVYEIQCTKVEFGPVVILRECKIIITSGAPQVNEQMIVHDFANVKVLAPVTVNDRANIQTNPFSTVNNFQGEPHANNKNQIEVQSTTKKNK